MLAMQGSGQSLSLPLALCLPLPPAPSPFPVPPPWPRGKEGERRAVSPAVPQRGAGGRARVVRVITRPGRLRGARGGWRSAQEGLRCCWAALLGPVSRSHLPASAAGTTLPVFVFRWRVSLEWLLNGASVIVYIRCD